MSLIEHPENQKPTKLRGFVRTQIDRIEGLLLSGYTIEAIRKMFETELGREINLRSFVNSLYLVRKERKDTGESKKNCIVQSNFSTPETPELHEQKTPVVQPPVERRDFSTVEQTAPEPEVVEPWKPPKKKINPHLLALAKKQAERDS